MPAGPTEADMRDSNSALNEHTKDFFESWTNYSTLIQKLDSYENIRSKMSGKLRGRVLDCGSGGMVDYSLEGIDRLTMVDLVRCERSLSRETESSCPITYAEGDVKALPFPDASYDVVLMKMLVHHLAGPSVKETRQNVLKALEESRRVLDTQGKLIIVESFLPRYAEFLEAVFFPFFKVFLSMISHPIVFQWSYTSFLEAAKKSGLQCTECISIPQGKWIVQFGIRWPTIFTPLRNRMLIFTKV